VEEYECVIGVVVLNKYSHKSALAFLLCLLVCCSNSPNIKTTRWYSLSINYTHSTASEFGREFVRNYATSNRVARTLAKSAGESRFSLVSIVVPQILF
jgi:hypothetical protein